MEKSKLQNENIHFIKVALCGGQIRAYWISVNYREAYEFASTELFNHESPLRGKRLLPEKLLELFLE